MTHTQTQGADGAGTKTAGEAGLRDLLAAAYDAGFNASGEGWNGEYPGDHKGDGDYEGPKREYLDSIATPAPASTPGVPDSVRALSEAATEGAWVFERMHDDFVGVYSDDRTGSVIANFAGFHAALRPKAEQDANARFAAEAVNHVRALIAAQPTGQSEPPILRVVVEVHPDRTDTRLTFGERIRPEPGVKAVEQAIAALTAEYEARGGCPVVGRQPAGQAGDAGERVAEIVNRWHDWIISASADMDQPEWSSGNRQTMEDDRNYLLSLLPGRQTAPNSTRTGAAETEDDGFDGRIQAAIAAWKEAQDTATIDEHQEDTDFGAMMCALAAADALAGRPEAPSDAGWRETFETIAQWCEETFGPITPERIVSRAGEEMDELRAEPARVEEAADVLICLARYPGLWAAVERKMKVNRGRKWRLMGDGTGYHIKPTPPSDPAPSGQAEG